MLVTGGSRGLGASIAELAASRGYDVCISCRHDIARADEVATKVRACGRRALVVQADVSKEPDVARMFKQVDDRLKSDGAIETRGKNLTDQQKAIQKRKDDLDVRMLAVQKAYTAQFTRLDTLLSQLQVTSSYLSQQIESLPKVNQG